MWRFVLVVLAGCDGAGGGSTVKIDDGSAAQIAALTTTVDALTDRVEALEAAAAVVKPIGGPPESGTVIATFTGAGCTGDAMFVPWPVGPIGDIKPEDVPIVAVTEWSDAGGQFGRYQSSEVVGSWGCGVDDDMCGYTVACADRPASRVYRLVVL